MLRVAVSWTCIRCAFERACAFLLLHVREQYFELIARAFGHEGQAQSSARSFSSRRRRRRASASARATSSRSRASSAACARRAASSASRFTSISRNLSSP